MKRGPKPGNIVSEATREKIRQAKIGKKHTPETRQKISDAMSNKAKSQGHRDMLSQSCQSTAKYLKRFEEMRGEYPAEKEFFDNNKSDLLELMEDVWSERELTQLRKHVEIYRVDTNTPYEYPSSSVSAVEDLLIELLDFKREVFGKLGDIDKNDLTH